MTLVAVDWGTSSLRGALLDDAGRVVAVLPWRIIDYWTMTRHVDLADYLVEPAVVETPS